MTDRLLTVEEVAERHRTTPNAIHMQRHRGLNPGALGVKVGKRVLWRESDLNGWFSEQLEAQTERVAS